MKLKVFRGKHTVQCAYVYVVVSSEGKNTVNLVPQTYLMIILLVHEMK